MVVAEDEGRAAKILRARARLEQDRRRGAHDLRTFCRLYQPKYRDAPHLAKLDDALDASVERLHRRGRVGIIVLEAPPRHFKTSRIMAHMARILRHVPATSVAYCSYAGDIAKRRSRNVRDLAARAGVWVGEMQTTAQRFDPSKSVAFWQTDSGGQFVAGGRHGQFVGEGFHFICCDDLFKDLAESLSPVVQDEAWATFKMLFARLEPGGTILLTNQRWGEDDPIGKLKEWIASDPDAPEVTLITVRAIEGIEIQEDEQGHERIVGGTPACPWRFTLDDLRERASALGVWFWPQYQQDTRPRGKRVFPELVRFDEPATEHAILLISCDPGISKRDANEGISTARKGKDPDPAGIVVAWAYLGLDKEKQPRVGLDVVLAEELWLEGMDLLDHLEELQTGEFAGAPCLLEEVSAFKLLEQVAGRLNRQLQITAITPRGSKFWRAQPAALSAKHSLVRVPRSGEWVNSFCKEVRDFTGREGRRDGRVDALTQLFDQAEILFGVKGAGVGSAGSSSLHESPF
jgi:hypothetical protein